MRMKYGGKKVGKGKMKMQERWLNQNQKVKQSMRFTEYQGEEDTWKVEK